METMTLPGIKLESKKRKPRAAAYKGETVTHPPAAPRKRLTCSTDVWSAMSDLATADREHMVAFDLDVRHRVIARRVVSIGCLTGVDVHPREVFKAAITNSAAAMIVSHNHPSGDPSPSPEDVSLTKRLRECGDLLGIRLLDHVVVGREGFVSFAERGWS